MYSALWTMFSLERVAKGPSRWIGFEVGTRVHAETGAAALLRTACRRISRIVSMTTWPSLAQAGRTSSGRMGDGGQQTYSTKLRAPHIEHDLGPDKKLMSQRFF